MIGELVKPNSVLASHANELATKDDKLLPDTKTASFVEATRADVYLALSGQTMAFDADGTCTDSCTE